MSAITISPARINDAAAIATLDREAWEGMRYSDAIPDGLHAWRIWCEHALTFVARTPGGMIVGAVLAFPCANETFCLHKIMVAADLRGQGIGSRLFSRLVGELDQRKAYCFLTVAVENHRAIELYRKWGFENEELVAGYYRKGEDRLVLTRLPVAQATPHASGD